MELCYYKSKIGNFGDDLNPYLLQKLGEKYGAFKSSDDILFFIGTILFDGFEGTKNIKNFERRNKIIAGSGIRFINKPLIIDDTYNISFLRGPLSSYLLKGDLNHFITDPAYLVRNSFQFQEVKKKYKYSFMPHFKSLNKADWNLVEERTGIKIILPTNQYGVDFILEEIAATEFLITEAMHGAIIADAFRVPWSRINFYSYLYESQMVSEFKWTDWSRSMDVDYKFNTIGYPKTIQLLEKKIDNSYFKRKRTSILNDSILKQPEKLVFSLSQDKILDEKMEQLNLAFENIANKL